MGTYICGDCGDRVEYSGGVPVRKLCPKCTEKRDWETLDWECPECGHIRQISTYYKEPKKSPSLMACGGCSTDERKEFSRFEVQG